MIRIKATISYDGSKFNGFQKQKKDTKTVAGEIEKALYGLNISTVLVGAGRTDSGVHATGQVIHFDVPSFWSDVGKLQFELNRKLDGIKIRKIEISNSDFHARFSAKSREYRYCFSTQNQTIFTQNYIASYDKFDIETLKSVLAKFEGEHDFAMFCKSGSVVSSTVRTISSCSYKSHKNIHIITIKADGFLRSQVRMIVDIAIKCALGNIELEDAVSQIECKKKISSRLAPACGLYLSRVIY